MVPEICTAMYYQCISLSALHQRLWGLLDKGADFSVTGSKVAVIRGSPCRGGGQARGAIPTVWVSIERYPMSFLQVESEGKLVL
jgi:hypothetical protein